MIEEKISTCCKAYVIESKDLGSFCSKCLSENWNGTKTIKAEQRQAAPSHGLERKEHLGVDAYQPEMPEFPMDPSEEENLELGENE